MCDLSLTSDHILATITETFWCLISTLGGMSLESTTCFLNRMNALRGRGMCSGSCCESERHM